MNTPMPIRRTVAFFLLALCFTAAVAHAQSHSAPFDVVGTTIAETQQAIRDGRTTCRAVVEQYLRRISAYDQKPTNGLRLNAIVTLNPEVLAEADVCEGHLASFRNRLTATQVSTVAKVSFTYRGGCCSTNV